MAIDSKTGLASANGDVQPIASLASYGQTVMASVGVSPAIISSDISLGTVIAGALAST